MIKKGEETQHIEKWMLRKAFDDELNPYLPSEVPAERHFRCHAASHCSEIRCSFVTN